VEVAGALALLFEVWRGWRAFKIIRELLHGVVFFDLSPLFSKESLRLSPQGRHHTAEEIN